MDKIYEQTMLFDFYGELLTEHQRSVYEDAVYRDMSLGEIAQERGISRQGVHDLIKRCDRILQEYESKLQITNLRNENEIGGAVHQSEEDSGRNRETDALRTVLGESG